MKLLEVMQGAFELFGPNGEHWVKGMPHSNDDFCSALAIGSVVGPHMQRTEQQWKLFDQARDALAAVVKTDSIPKWNDAPERTWPEVKAAFEQAIKNCQQAGQ